MHGGFSTWGWCVFGFCLTLLLVKMYLLICLLVFASQHVLVLE